MYSNSHCFVFPCRLGATTYLSSAFLPRFFFTLPSSLFSDKQRSFQLEKNFTTSRGWNAWTVENTQRYKKEEERSIHISRGLKWSVWSSGSFFLYFFMFLTSCLRHESLDAHGLFLHRPFNKKKQKGTRGSSSSLLFVCSWHRRYTTSFPVAKGTTMLPPWRFRFLMGTKENVSSLLRFFRY